MLLWITFLQLINFCICWSLNVQELLAQTLYQQHLDINFINWIVKKLVSDLIFYTSGKNLSLGSSGYNLLLITVGTSVGILRLTMETFENIGLLVLWTVDIFSQTTYAAVFDHQWKWGCNNSDRITWHCESFDFCCFLRAIHVESCHQY